jgi:hypothetical protein
LWEARTSGAGRGSCEETRRRRCSADGKWEAVEDRTPRRRRRTCGWSGRGMGPETNRELKVERKS